jgi:hypothetical protein
MKVQRSLVMCRPRIGIGSTGSYGAGLLRFMQQAKVTVFEGATPDNAAFATGGP